MSIVSPSQVTLVNVAKNGYYVWGYTPSMEHLALEVGDEPVEYQVKAVMTNAYTGQSETLVAGSNIHVYGPQNFTDWEISSVSMFTSGSVTH